MQSRITTAAKSTATSLPFSTTVDYENRSVFYNRFYQIQKTRGLEALSIPCTVQCVQTQQGKHRQVNSTDL